MDIAFEVARAVSMVAFLFYGIACLATSRMVAEFERFRLARFRRLTGALEVAGGLGLLAGYFVPPLTLVAAAGLALLMVFGVAARLRIRDSLLQIAPALAFCVLNAFIVYCLLRGDATPLAAPDALPR